MKKIITFVSLYFCFSYLVTAQSNCSNPTSVNICPSTILVGETNGGKGDNAPLACNKPGEDVVYRLNAPNGASQIFVSVLNATGPFTLLLEPLNCGSGSCVSKSLSSGNSNTTFGVGNFNTYFVWVDAATTITYDISFGGDTGSVYISTPDLRGNIGFDGSVCDTPIFNVTKPYYQVSYNGVKQTNPMTLAPLFIGGTICSKTFIKNTTGIEGIKKVDFDFNPAGFANVNGPPIIAGTYNTGTWIAGGSGNHWTYTFQDAFGLGRGDFTGVPNTCLTYEFCFSVIPLSNNPQLTNVDVTLHTDGFGTPFNGYISLGCCPIPFTNCISNLSGGGASSSSAIGYAFADPGGPLPIELIDFNAFADGSKVTISWSTATEINNDYFTLQRSDDVLNWSNLVQIDGAGNSSTTLHYKYDDRSPLDGVSYYRLRQTDFDGKTSFSNAVSVKFGKLSDVVIYPNPASDFIIVKGKEIESIHFYLYNDIGTQINCNSTKHPDELKIDLTGVAGGLYLLVLKKNNEFTGKEKIIVRGK